MQEKDVKRVIKLIYGERERQRQGKCELRERKAIIRAGRKPYKGEQIQINR
jgi:hypothetical protein